MKKIKVARRPAPPFVAGACYHLLARCTYETEATPPVLCEEDLWVSRYTCSMIPGHFRTLAGEHFPDHTLEDYEVLRRQLLAKSRQLGHTGPLLLRVSEIT